MADANEGEPAAKRARPQDPIFDHYIDEDRIEAWDLAELATAALDSMAAAWEEDELDALQQVAEAAVLNAS